MEMSKIARQSLEKINKIQKKGNWQKINKSERFQKGDIVCAFDRYHLQGSREPLKTTKLQDNHWKKLTKFKRKEIDKK